MIKNWIYTGDTHGTIATISRVSNISRNMPECIPAETGIIILGDAGLNFYLNKTDQKRKKMLNGMNYHIYCVRGNHEERPENIETYHLVFDEEVNGEVWIEDKFPNLKFFKDGGTYTINGHSVLVIGGAYSVDKHWRLQRAGYSVEDADIADPKKCGWFKDEQLTRDEMIEIYNLVQGKHYNFVLTHTCPLSWQPTDLFLGCIDQSTVDNTTEVWLDFLKDFIQFDIWLFGHYHADRIERPGVEQMYQDYESLETIWNRWRGECTYHKEWWLPKSPHMELLATCWDGKVGANVDE